MHGVHVLPPGTFGITGQKPRVTDAASGEEVDAPGALLMLELHGSVVGQNPDGQLQVMVDAQGVPLIVITETLQVQLSDTEVAVLVAQLTGRPVIDVAPASMLARLQPAPNGKAKGKAQGGRAR